MTTWLCVSPNITLISMLPLCLLYPVCYYVITKLSNQNPSHSMNYDRLNSSEDVSQRKENTSKVNQQGEVCRHLEGISVRYSA